MTSKKEALVLNGRNYAIYAPYMENLLKIKGLWKYMKASIKNLMDVDAIFIIDGKKDEAVGSS